MTQEHIKECCYDYGKVPYEIHDNYGEGIVGKEYYTTKEERPRKVKLVINSFRGISWDAVHYYGTLKVFAPHVRKEGEPGCFGGYLGEDTPLFKDLDIVIELWQINLLEIVDFRGVMEIAIVKIVFRLKKGATRQSLTERIAVLTPKHSIKNVRAISVQKVEDLKKGMMKEVPGMDVSYSLSISFVKPLIICGLDEKGKEVM